MGVAPAGQGGGQLGVKLIGDGGAHTELPQPPVPGVPGKILEKAGEAVPAAPGCLPGKRDGVYPDGPPVRRHIHKLCLVRRQEVSQRIHIPLDFRFREAQGFPVNDVFLFVFDKRQKLRRDFTPRQNKKGERVGQAAQDHGQGFDNFPIGNHVEVVQHDDMTVGPWVQLTEQLHRMLHRRGGKGRVRQDTPQIPIVRLEGIQAGGKELVKHRRGIVVAVQPNPYRRMPAFFQPQ